MLSEGRLRATLGRVFTRHATFDHARATHARTSATMRTIACLGAIVLTLSMPWPVVAADVFSAVGEGDLDGLRQCIDRAPACVDSTDANGMTPLHLTDDPALIALLLESGADPHRTDGRGRTPYRVAMDQALRFPWLRERKLDALGTYVDTGVAFPIDGEDGRFYLHASCGSGTVP